MPLAQLGAEPWPDVELVDMELDAAEVSGGAAGRPARGGREFPGGARERSGASRLGPSWLAGREATFQARLLRPRLVPGRES